MSDHRVPLLGDAWRRHPDPESSRDPRVLTVVRELSRISAGPAPAPVFRAELRAQLVAITPRVVAESIAAETAMVDILPRPAAAAATPQHADVAAKRTFSFGRVLGVTTCVITAFVLLLGGAVVMSRKALPGDTLYGLKRASERFELATDGSDTERATDLLSFATTRTKEATALLERASATASGRGPHAAGTINPGTQKLIISTLSSSDSDVADASRLLAQQAIADNSAAPLTNMTNWAPNQLDRLTTLWNAMPEGSSLQKAAAASKALVTKAQTRATDLIPSVDSVCLSTAPTDTLGPKPCTSAPASTTKPTTSRTTTAPTAPVGKASPVNPVTGTPVVAPRSGSLGSVSTPTPSGGPLPIPSNVPTLPVTIPTSVPTLPVSVGSCGATVTLGGLKVGVGTCKGVKISVGP